MKREYENTVTGTPKYSENPCPIETRSTTVPPGLAYDLARGSLSVTRAASAQRKRVCSGDSTSAN